MILFNEIFEKAVRMFDDPDIRQAYIFNKPAFASRMRDYLLNGKNLFKSPTSIVYKLSQYSDPSSGQEEITGETGSSFVLEGTPAPNSVFSYKINKEFVIGSYDSETNTVTLPREITAEDTVVIQWYFAGAFTADFSSCLRGDFPMDSFMESIKVILAKSIECMWDEEEMNRALENRNILSDTDFKFYSPANSVNAKIQHHKQVLAEMDTLLSELNWIILGTPRGGSNFGK